MPGFPDFPRHGKVLDGFSTPWKNNFHTMENPVLAGRSTGGKQRIPGFEL